MSEQPSIAGAVANVLAARQAMKDAVAALAAEQQEAENAAGAEQQ